MLHEKEMLYIIAILLGVQGFIWVLIDVHGMIPPLIHSMVVINILIPTSVVIIPQLDK